MSCESLDGGITLGCDNNIGGGKRLWLTEKSNVSGTTLSSPGDEIQSFSMAGSPASSFYEYEFNVGNLNYTQVEAYEETAGRMLTTITITLTLNRREKTKRDNLALLRFKRLAAVIEDNNGICWYAPDVVLTNIDGGSGAAKSDPNQYIITLVGEQDAAMNTVLTAAIEAVEA
jgi:hypothetical protein